MLIKTYMQVDEGIIKAHMKVDEGIFFQKELLICMRWLIMLIKVHMQVDTHMQVEESFSTGSPAAGRSPSRQPVGKRSLRLKSATDR
jgi:hypothetical protein